MYCFNDFSIIFWNGLDSVIFALFSLVLFFVVFVLFFYGNIICHKSTSIKSWRLVLLVSETRVTMTRVITQSYVEYISPRTPIEYNFSGNSTDYIDRCKSIYPTIKAMLPSTFCSIKYKQPTSYFYNLKTKKCK